MNIGSGKGRFRESAAPLLHSEPIFPGYFADPFVWNYDGTYYAIGTGETEAIGDTGTNVFPMLKSTDLFHWEFVGRAMARPDTGLGDCFWAPAVACTQGKFYLYYSVGHGDKQHQLRVASSDSPAGPYRDRGISLLDGSTCPFAMDPHPYQDDGSEWYLFYARDFLDCDSTVRAGTALAAARLKTMTLLEDEEGTVLRAGHDWQRFQAGRWMYGRTWDWYTLEGPCVVKHENRYYCFYSGGRWENESYGVDYGIADKVLGPYDDSGNESGPRVLRSIPGKLIGPGHNSIITGPDGKTSFIVYHAWNETMTARQMHIDRLVWTTQGPRCASAE